MAYIQAVESLTGQTPSHHAVAQAIDLAMELPYLDTMCGACERIMGKPLDVAHIASNALFASLQSVGHA